MDYAQEMHEYEDNLWDKSIGKIARDYLKNRHISPATAKTWHIGYCPKGFNPKCYTGMQSRFWEKMWGRITLPVFNSNGDLIAISGRTIIDEKPKYMHYPFPTRKRLFGLYINEKAIMKHNAVIFTEGQLDVISAWQHGFQLCACTFGAHFSSEQIALASRYTDRIYVLYDDDEAGQEGAQKSLNKAKIKGDVKVRLLRGILKNGEDLDNWIQRNDYHKILNYINSNTENALKLRLSLLE